MSIFAFFVSVIHAIVSLPKPLVYVIETKLGAERGSALFIYFALSSRNVQKLTQVVSPATLECVGFRVPPTYMFLPPVPKQKQTAPKAVPESMVLQAAPNTRETSLDGCSIPSI